MDLHYIDGSPFSRILRVLALEHDLPVRLHEITVFPPPPDLQALNPMWQVPVLVLRGEALFPTRIALDGLLDQIMGDHPDIARRVSRPGQTRADEQVLAVILTMGDALATHHYLDWAGFGPVGKNRLGFNPPERYMSRVLATLDWLEARLDGTAGFQPGHISVQDIALAVFILWTESRGPIAWRGRPRTEALVARLETRASFQATAPRPHSLLD